MYIVSFCEELKVQLPWLKHLRLYSFFYFLCQIFYQGHQGATAGAIPNPGDMDAFKRQQTMAQGGRARILGSYLSYVPLLPPCLPFFCFSFLPLIASAFRYFASSARALCWSLNPRKEKWPVRSQKVIALLCDEWFCFALWGYCVF